MAREKIIYILVIETKGFLSLFRFLAKKAVKTLACFWCIRCCFHSTNLLGVFPQLDKAQKGFLLKIIHFH